MSSNLTRSLQGLFKESKRCLPLSRVMDPAFRLPQPPVRRSAAGRKASINIFVRVCKIFYSIWNLEMVIRRSTITSRKEIKTFSKFHCTYIFRKETDFECRARRFSFVCHERRFCAVSVDFAVKGDLQISSMKKDKSCEFFCLLKKIQNTIEEVRK